MQKKQQKCDPNLQITWRNLYVNVNAILLLLLYYHRQWSRAISKGANLDSGILKQYFLLLLSDHAYLAYFTVLKLCSFKKKLTWLPIRANDCPIRVSWSFATKHWSKVGSGMTV